jgi:hypothetical protein
MAARKTDWVPSRKWILAQVIALAGVAVSWVDSGWDDTETKLLIAVAVQAISTYLLPNLDTPGGHGLTRKARRRRGEG